MTYRNYKLFFNEALMFDVTNSITQMNSESNDLGLDRFKAALDEAIKPSRPVHFRKLH